MKQKSFIIKKLESDKLLHSSGVALDLGCGKGLDTLYLASIGYQVDAVDKNDQNINGIKEEIKTLEKPELVSLFLEDINEFNIKPDVYDIIIASNSLPFINSKESVESLLGKITKGLKKDGVAYISLFGPHDAWSDRKDMSFFDYDEAQSILEKLPVSIYFKSTEEGYASTMKGDMKWWHIHRFYLKRI